MTNFIRAQGFVMIVGACVLMTITGCEGDEELGSPSADTSSSEDVGEAREPLTYTQDGFKVTWTYVGHPYAARKIAACGAGKIFALNDDYRLFSNSADGSDANWQLVNWPAAAREIACDGSSLFALNSDKNLYRSPSSGAILWSWVGKPSSADHIASGDGNIYALNINKSIYTSYGGLVWQNGAGFVETPDEGKDGSWIWRNTASQADRVTGAGDGNLEPDHRAFALNLDKSLWYNDQLLFSSSGANWHPLNNGGLTFIEISAGASTVLYGLTTTYDLWKATFIEDNCSDGVDNDASGSADADDSTCLARYGNNYCATHQDGDYCYDRFWPSASGRLATCSGGQLVAVQGSLGCPCHHGATGADYLPPCIQ